MWAKTELRNVRYLLLINEKKEEQLLCVLGLALGIFMFYVPKSRDVQFGPGKEMN